MSQQNEFDPLFEEMKSAELSDSAKRDSLANIQRKLSRKRPHFIPTLASGIAAVAVIIFLVFFASNSSMFENISSGGAGEDQLVFTGSSENWAIEYVVTYPREDWEKIVYTITFIGDEVPETVEYSIEGTSGGSSGTDTLYADRTVSGTSESNGAKVQENEEIDATIEWDGRSESFLLTREE
ncbi:hypothetical protein [Planomicrobium sp. MB-3u-38]|uniref:hypothetical protein n=1 Tax=Planomicrobium sp. MB-3u-38 TaxID=2058318 RepID=UPI000C7A9E53|nr:hypothetical protein [Planomicrobium sp. MB-3u-38]PKH12104.1 hypothetical protein CXF70_00960 [Planomicrobium sp. MB-3u-38]